MSLYCVSTGRGPGGGGHGRAAVLALLRMLAAVAMLASAGLPAAAAEKVDVEIRLEDTFGRVILTFPDRNILPTYKVNADNGVLVLEFEEPVDMRVDRISSLLTNFVTIARLDPEKKGARFALTRSTRVSTMEAGPKLFLDFLPGNWSGPPPRLPPEVIAELAKRAEEAAKAAREAELLRSAGTKTPKLDFRVARTPTFTRFSFRWNVPYEAEFQRNGEGVSLVFNRPSKVDLAPLRADMPPFVDDITVESDEDSTAFALTIPESADVRAFREEDAYIVDVQGEIDPSAMSNVSVVVRGATDAHSKIPGHATQVTTAPGTLTPEHAADHGAPDAGHSAEGDGHSAAPLEAAGQPGAAGAQSGPAIESVTAPPQSTAHGEAPAASHAEEPVPPAPHGAPAEHAAVPAPHSEVAEPTTSPADHAAVPDHASDHAPAEPQATAPPVHAEAHAAPGAEAHPTVAADHGSPAHEPAATDDHAPPLGGKVADESKIMAEMTDEVAERRLVDGVIRVESKRIGGSTRIVFPYTQEIGAAMFTRGPALWLVFDSPAPIDPAPLQDALAGFARKIEPMRIGESQVIRVELVGPLLSTMNPDGERWIVTIGDMVMEPTRPIPIKRAVREDSQMVLEVPFGPVNRIIEVTDPVIGDRLYIVTGKGQPRGLVKPQSFAEVDGLSSAHGLAFVPKVDDLQIKSAGELVTLMRPEGLELSPDIPVKQSSFLDVPADLSSAFSGRPGSIDFTGSVAENPPDHWNKWHQLLAAVSQAREPETGVEAWYKAATFKIANGLGPEAMGILNHILRMAPAESSNREMLIRRAAASLLMHRPEDTIGYLDKNEFAESPDAAVWRSIALNDLGEYMEARKNLSRAEPVVGAFPPAIQRRFLLAGIETTIELNDFARARALLGKVDPKTLSPSEKARLDLLNARAMDAAGNPSDAVELLANVIRKHRGPDAAEATYRLVHLQRREGLITLDQAIDRLEQLAVSWRGDAIEIKTLRTLGQYTVEKGDYRRAFEVMRAAVQIDPQSDVTRLMQDEMQAAFASLYLDGKADQMKPVDALALYYDFREMTPPGRRGDAMVRKLAERLIEVDLLPQAAELLDHQIENRLVGASRAQVAADLALVYLLDQRPDRALLTLNRTRQADLPLAIERQRRIVEARALAETGKGTLGLDLLTPLSGNDVARLKADILWQDDRFLESGEQFERLLGGRWHDNLPLSDLEQMDVMKAAVSYSLAGERLAMDRLRAKFATKMSDTANGPAFEVVTSPIMAKGATFDEIVRSVASVNTLAAFVNDYRQRYLELGGGDKPELATSQTEEAAPAEVAAAEPAAG